MLSSNGHFGKILSSALILPVMLATVFIGGLNANHRGLHSGIDNITAEVSFDNYLNTQYPKNLVSVAQSVANAAIGTQSAVEETGFLVYSNVVPTAVSDIKSSLIGSDNQPCLWVGQEIADFAVKFDGFKYVYGAASPSTGFDCSGLAYYVYGQFGYTLPRTASRQFLEGTAVESSQLQPGDLLFFATDGGKSASHVGIYIGNNKFINATTAQHGVMIDSLDETYWSKAYVGAKRIVTNKDAAAMLFKV